MMAVLTVSAILIVLRPVEFRVIEKTWEPLSAALNV